MKSSIQQMGIAALVALCGCTSDTPITGPARGLDASLEKSSEYGWQDRNGNVLPLERFTSKHDRCRGRAYGAFDFWVGRWDVYTAGVTAVVGTNVVTKDVGGCVIEEHWSDSDGIRGRSLNAYDASTGQWSQLWMDQTGGALQLSGTGGEGMMQMAGSHVTNRFDPTLQTDRITWKRTARNRVRQVGELATAEGPFSELYNLDYLGVRQETSIAPSPFEFCSSPARPRFHSFDFLLGDWTVRGEGRETLRTTVSTDLGGCLVEERMRGKDGYEAVAYSGFRSATFVWNWMFMDSRGVQIQLSGPSTLTGTNMILTGRRLDRYGHMVDVQVEWIVIDQNTVEQRWSFSSDSGATWTGPKVVTMTH